MESPPFERKYETIDRKFLDTFYRECGREITLAYTVLNQANTWGVTFFAAVLGTSLLGLVKKDASSAAYSFDYPNPFHWLFLVLAWGLLLRFLSRSALALSNLYRWNALASAVWECAALPETNAKQAELNDKLVEQVDSLMMKWQDPKPPLFILWGTLKLMYLLPSVILLGLIVWGMVSLPRDLLYWLSLTGFILWTFAEIAFFFRWNKGRGQALRGPDAERFLVAFRLASAGQAPPNKETAVSDLEQTDPPLSHFSPVTALARHVFDLAIKLSVMYWLSKLNPLFRPRNKLTPEEVNSKVFTRKRAFAIEMYLIGWLAVEFVLVLLASFELWPRWVRLTAAVFAACRIVEVVQVAVNATLFDALSGRPDDRVASRARMIVLSGVNFIELCVCFGIIYANDYLLLRGAGRPITAFYLSVITQLTIGYGDVYPTGWLRVVAAVHGLVAILFVVLVFGRFMASLPQVRGIFENPVPPPNEPK